MHRVFLVRHALRADTEDPAWKQSAARPDDPPLSATGLQQARAVGAYLRDRGITALYSSPFLRTLQTAQAISEATGAPVRVDEALSEWLRPTWFSAKPEFLAGDELQAQFSGYDAAYRSCLAVDYPEPEEGVQVYARVQRLIEHLSRDESGAVALVGHGASMTQAARALTGETISFEIAAVAEFERVDGQWRSVRTVQPHLLPAERAAEPESPLPSPPDDPV